MLNEEPPFSSWVVLSSPDKSGLSALGGDFSIESLTWAYRNGIFPWYKVQNLIHWFSPDPRFIITADSFKVPKSLKPLLNSNRYKITFNTVFERVVQACMESERPRDEGTWILPEMVPAYTLLHKDGLASSSEAWNDDKLVGGLYGVSMGKNFSGESMFSIESNASKLSFVHFAKEFFERGGNVIDCQIHSELFQNFGGKNISRDKFEYLWNKGLD